MGNPSVSESNFPPTMNFYDTSLVSSDTHGIFVLDSFDNSLNAPSITTSTTSHLPLDNNSQGRSPSTTGENFILTPTSISPKSQSGAPTPAQPTSTHAPSSSSSSSPSSSPSSSRIQKRTLNTLAARRYRQKRLDQMTSLEAKLKESEREKELLQIRVARLEGEVEVLRGLLRPA
jgi:hypothetical protein